MLLFLILLMVPMRPVIWMSLWIARIIMNLKRKNTIRLIGVKDGFKDGLEIL
jgi:hypothetical protein